MTQFNNATFGMILSHYDHFMICPLKGANVDLNATDTEFVRTTADEAQFWGLYGVKPDGMADALHDGDAGSVAEAAAFASIQTERGLNYVDGETHGDTGKPTDIAGFIDSLNSIILDETPEIDAPTARDDDLDNHPLDELRTAFQEAAENPPKCYTNHYNCDCGASWQDQWSCACDDRCPLCNTSCSPTHSENMAPEVVNLTIDPDEHFAQMLPPASLWPLLSDLCSVESTKLQHPTADRFIGNVDAPFSEQVFDVSIALAEPEIEPYGALDNDGRKSVTGVR
jgi:hypothetical protein